jgi:phosphatidate cytidylyltransferase
LALIVSVLATQEVLGLLAAAGMRPVPWLAYVGNMLLIAYEWAMLYGADSLVRAGRGETDAFLFWLLHLLAMAPGLLLFAVVIAEMCRYRSPGGAIANLAGSLLAFLYIGIMLKFAVSLRMDWGMGALAAWIIVVKMGDTGAYTVGRLIGRHKLVPLISPGKTVEGAVGDLVFSWLGSWLVFRWLLPLSAPEAVGPGPWWGWIVFGLLVGTAGMVGDLAESLLKRDVGRKDSSDWLPGFGGVLDILDSLLLSAPVAYYCWASGLVGR